MAVPELDGPLARSLPVEKYVKDGVVHTIFGLNNHTSQLPACRRLGVARAKRGNSIYFPFEYIAMLAQCND